MSDEKRIKDFEPATDLLIDDWFAVDSPSQGTRKMQASMFQEGLQTQITTNTENIALHSGQISVLQQGVGNIGDKVDVLDAAITVEEYSASKLYAVDEDCVYEGVRYKCTTAIETPEAFTPSHWQAISIEGELNELNSSKLNKSGGTITGSLSIVNNLDVKGYPLSDLNGYKKIPVVTAAGVLEIGRYIDMHSTAEDTSDYTFRLNNDTQGHLIATGTIAQGSSRKIKENIEEFTAEEALKILQLNPIKFDYIKGSKNERGFIAEEVAEILPNLVTDEEGIEGTKEYIPASLNYIGLIPYLIKVVQLQQKQIDKLLDVTNS